MPTSNKVALITGCSEPASLGAALAIEFKRRGYRVYATARNIKTMGNLQAEGCDLLTLDVVSPTSIQEAISAVTTDAGRLDLLVNNASPSSG
ncbi:uncharacterized protein EHS24_003133 [Apiotrichum porosum]|uniref:Uncharacterized protein n=1 Tax=Apiotrichum porosum TaxID=105984 RepID=A0A427XFP7_9TREE|nr:uncharacterized protein EHS24_003133 [Apiotrichum porosum]RSH77573.1 hypothetical protein EHS24_003133 [Apiotrichum porosum]